LKQIFPGTTNFEGVKYWGALPECAPWLRMQEKGFLNVHFCGKKLLFSTARCVDFILTEWILLVEQHENKYPHVSLAANKPQ